jgi:hypothetical protein
MTAILARRAGRERVWQAIERALEAEQVRL